MLLYITCSRVVKGVQLDVCAILHNRTHVGGDAWHAQVYLAALEYAYLRAKAALGARQDAALDALGELGRCVAQAHSGIVAGASATLAGIVRGGVDFAMQARLPGACGRSATCQGLRHASVCARVLEQAKKP